MKVSIVTISFNQGPFLERALRSVIEQDYEDVEYIVVDPGSTDGSKDIIERYWAHISKVIYEPDEGPADGLNKGLQQATGEVFGYINADDAYLPGTLSKAVRAFQLDRNVDVVYAHGFIIDHTGSIVRRFRSDKFNLWRSVYGGVCVMQQSTFFRRRAVQESGAFNTANRTCWDGELLLDLALAGKRLKLINDYWSVFTIHPGSISGSGRLAGEYLADQKRLFTKVVGREPRRIDMSLCVAARLGKWLASPMTPLLRAFETLAGPPSARLL